MSPRLSVFLPVVRRWWALLLVGGVVAGIAGYAFVSQQKPSYEAKVELLVGPINTNFDTLKASGQLAQSYAQLASSGKVLQATISQLKLPLSTTQLDSHVRTTANAVTRVLSIRVQDDNPQLATKIANSLASNLATLATAGTVSPAAGQLRVIDPADTATRIRAKTGIIVAIAVLFGMFATLIGVLLVEYLSGRVRSEEELAEVAQVACLGVVEGLRRRSPEGALLVETEPESPSAASYRLLAAKVESTGNGTQPVRSLLVLGAEEAQKSGELAANLAAVLARTGRQVTLVDANSSEGEITSMFGLKEQPGIGEWLQGKAFTKPPASQWSGMSVLARGAAPSDRVESGLASEAVTALLGGTDLVVVNAAPLTRSPAALAWAKAADATLLVAQRGVTRRESVSDAVESLRLVGANVIGAALVHESGALSRRRSAASRATVPQRSTASERRGPEVVVSNEDHAGQPARWAPEVVVSNEDHGGQPARWAPEVVEGNDEPGGQPARWA